ncbi:hypothetical protein D3C73_1405240 [compost metagenome]
MHLEFAIADRAVDAVLAANVNTSLQQRRQIGGSKGVETVSMRLGGPVATEQLVIEEQADFIYRMVGCQIQRVQQVGLAIGTQFRQWNLRTGDNHRLGQVFQHE